MNNANGVSGGGAAATGCYKCGRPGHWSRDCPSNPTTGDPNPEKSLPPPNPTTKPIAKPKEKAPRKTRPKLTPDLLLSETTGIGYILRYFPKAFKCRGRGREASDLRHLLSLYAEWHSRLLPYYDFGQFIHKVEQVGATRRVKVCLRELHDRVADGLDPMKLQDPEVQENSIDEDASGGLNVPSHSQEDDLPNDDTFNFHEDIPQDIFEKESEEMPMHVDVGGEAAAAAAESIKSAISEEQKCRMEANRLKALERAAARKRSSS